ncbi:PorP/SprF family type IX secretion system membrane protein [Mongoliibacter ruber]|uniref:Type IX secretion system PorP/SprF family membrane protein n=1 Tax=Mongoliibacter ruber TaxID=1750599 RepID=A0A2T0WUG5_9BACT|nr:type IX secretion system membrane protein PorP/SprF [Mongoliibacter ruber]PRY90343.1 type IX secretion system PorP/SprF family membrane protein [Mongoliibacter ruber]
MKKLIIISIGLFLVISLYEVKAQQVPQFSQYMFNPLFINPAYTGYKEQLYVQSYYRKQWAGVQGSPETIAIAADGYLPDKNIGIGLVGMTDRLGAQRTSSIYANLSYHLRLSETGYLSFGLGIGYVNSLIDGNELSPGNPNDPSVPGSRNQISYPDLKAGVFYYDDKYFMGIAFDNLLTPILNFDNGEVMAEPRNHMNISAGMWMDINRDVAFRPSFMFMDDFKSPARLDLNGSFVFVDKFWVGASYRTALDYANRSLSSELKRSTGIVGLIEVFVTESLRVGYAYDHNITGFNVRSFTTHDISIGYLFPARRVRSVSPRNF